MKINKALLTTSLQGNDLLIKIQFKDVHVFPFDLKFNVSFPEKSWNREHLELAVCRCPAKNLPLQIPENSQENTCAGVYLLIKSQASCNTLKKETLPQVLHFEFCKTFNSKLFTEQIWATAFWHYMLWKATIS